LSSVASATIFVEGPCERLPRREADVGNILLEDVQYKIEETKKGRWRRYVYPSGARFMEYTSHARLFGLPVVHYTYGICPETGRRVLAKGILAVGRFAVGAIAVGHVALGFAALGQLAVGLLLALGQGGIGLYALGQFSLGIALGVGQFATGHTAIAQFGIGTYVLAQVGWGKYVWSMKGAQPEAVTYFTLFLSKLRELIP
jgi:hypothetical protein